MRKGGILVIATFMAFSASVQAADKTSELPSFLPDYYAPALTLGGQCLESLSHAPTEGGERWKYRATDPLLELSIESIDTNDSRSDTLCRILLNFFDEQMHIHHGRFHVVARDEIHAVISEPSVERHCFAYRLPQSVHIWIYSLDSTRSELLQGQFEKIKSLVNRQRYEGACDEGNVAMGYWGDHLYEHASDLLQTGRKKEAVAVLERMLPTSPYHYQAHLDLMFNTDNPRTAAQCAKTVLDNAEDPELLKQAEAFLGLQPKTYESVPYLDALETGLQVVLIPLPPCNIRLLEDTARIYQEITHVPVKIRRLRSEWTWSRPERIAYQKAVERIVTKELGETEFIGWAEEEYVDALQTVASREEALPQYFADKLLAEVKEEPGQYRINAYANLLCKILKAYRSTDNRTMYVGVTQANLYAGDNNYLFSLAWMSGTSRASMLSYHMLQARMSGEEYESRPRLAERLAKELVPASLKLLDIPRSTDPRCPYSYSDGVDRVDEKTLTLAEPVVAALEEYRNQPGGVVATSRPHDCMLFSLAFGCVALPGLWLTWHLLKGREN